jgi:hypothetical protein
MVKGVSQSVTKYHIWEGGWQKCNVTNFIGKVTCKDKQKYLCKARAMVLVVKWLRQMAHNQEVVGLNPGTVYWMDVSDANYYIHKNNKNKGSSMGHIKQKKTFVALHKGGRGREMSPNVT